MGQKEILETVYKMAVDKLAVQDWNLGLPDSVKEDIRYVVEKSGALTAVYTALVTLFCQKVYNPDQDIRYHQKKMSGGFSGRTLDSNVVTPFLKEHDFPAMSTSAWLTRSIESSSPYTLDYPEDFKDKELKRKFLSLINEVQVNGVDSRNVLLHFMMLLIKQRENSKIELAKPHSLSISDIIQVLELHFNYRYSCQGASRLPVLAIYAAYQCMVREIFRFRDKVLCPLEAHTSADSQSGQIGDIQVNHGDGSAFEGVEVKHQIPIDAEMVRHAYSKFMVYRTDRYYLLTTADMDAADWESINREIRQIRRNHGCQVIVNGVYSSLRYYLRMLDDTALFIEYYVSLLERDKSIKYPHLVAWNEIISKTVF